MTLMKLRKPDTDFLYRVGFFCLVWLLVFASIFWIEEFLLLTATRSLSHFVIFMASSVAIFTNFVALAVLLQRTLHSMTKRVYLADADRQSKQEKIRQVSAQFVFWSAIVCYVLFACKAAFLPNGVGDWLTGWLFASLRDASIVADTAKGHVNWGLMGPRLLSPVSDATGKMMLQEYANLHNLVRSVLAICLLTLPFRLVSRSAAFLTSLCQRLARRFDATIDSAFVETLRTREMEVRIFDEHPQVMKVVQSLMWLGFCYALLFWLFGFAGGAIGGTISSFLEFSIRDAWHSNYANIHALRPFLGAVIASYATVPFAIMSSAFLPARKPALLVLNSNSILFSENFLLPLNFRIQRSMNDISGMSLELHKSDYQRSTLRLSFFSGGNFSCKLKQLEKIDLKHLIGFVDENARECVLDANVLALKQSLSQEVSPGSEVPESNSMEFEALESSDVESVRERRAEFKATIFVPHAPDTVLQSGTVRIVKQLSSKTDSAVYLVRRTDGRLCLLKQFVVAPELLERMRLVSETDEMSSPPISVPEILEDVPPEAMPETQKFMNGNHDTAKLIDQTPARLPETFDKFCIENSVYVSYEYVQGEDLQSMVSRLGASQELEVVAWAIQLAEIMDSLHLQSKPVVYGVLRPSKLILDNLGSLHLTDVSTLEQLLDGTATSAKAPVYASKGASRTMIGEQSYIAPEQLRGEATCQSDIYSFGCTLFYLLTGRHPDALRPADLSNENILLSDWFIQLIRACTAFDPEARPKTFAEILQILKSHESLPESLTCRRKKESPLALSGAIESSQTPSELILKLARCRSLCTTDDGAIIELTSKQRAEMKL
jgi:serine/threonine protein kinase